MNTMTDWDTIVKKCKAAANKDDWNGFWKTQIDAAFDLTKKLDVSEFFGIPEICLPIALAAIDSMRDSLTAGESKDEMLKYDAATKYIRAHISSTTARIPTRIPSEGDE